MKAEILEPVDTDVGGIGLADGEATTVRGGTTVTLVEGAKVDIATRRIITVKTPTHKNN